MGDWKKEGKDKPSGGAMAFRRKCVRLIAYIYVFLMVLNRRLSVRAKTWLSVSFCGCVVAVVMAFSLAGQQETKLAGKEMAVVRTLSGTHNRITGGQTEASIELNCSRVAGDQGGRNHVAASGQPRAAGTSDGQPNQVVDKPELLSPVQALLENNGEERQGGAVEMQYQQPVGLSAVVKQNYEGIQSAGGDIRKLGRVQGVTGETASAGAISASAISPAGVQEAGSPAPAASPAGIQAEEQEKGAADTEAPVLTLEAGGYVTLQGKDRTIFCTNDSRIPVTASDGAAGSGIAQLCYAYGDRLMYCIDPSRNEGIQVSDNFYGLVTASCFDVAGNRSDPLSGYFLVENQAPQIRFSQDSLCTAPYTCWVDIGETGDVVSGIRDVKCTVDGKPYKITDLTILEKAVLDEDLEVPARCEFSLPLTGEGEYAVVVTVTDYAGNTSTEKKAVRVTKPELISVFMPERFAIHIDPQQLAGREQIYSDDITLKNDSGFDVQVTVKKVEVSVRDEVSGTGIKKDCDLYLVAPDTGEKIRLKKGENQDVYSYCLDKTAQDHLGRLRFVGNTSEGSDAMWEDADVMIRVELGFAKAGQ